MSSDGILFQVAPQSFTVKGTDISRHVNNMQVYEDICKPYLTGTATIIDNADIINGLQLVGGEPVTFTVQSDNGPSYSQQNMQLFAIKGQRSATALRTVVYQMQFIGQEFFGDRQNIVQQSFKQITGTDIISRIHNQYLGSTLNIPVPSSGLLATNNTIVASSVSPFKFINDIRQQLMFGQYQTGHSMYYRDATQANLAPMEYLITNAGSGPTFVQKATWGASYQDIFTAYNAIIALTTSNDENSHGGNFNMLDISAALIQERKVQDIFQNKRTWNITPQQPQAGQVLGTSIASLINLPNFVSSSQGGRQNYYWYDSEKVPTPNVRQTDVEALYKAMISSAPQVTIKVPAQGGMGVTVGKGFTANLLPPIGDQDNSSTDAQNSGAYLAIKVMHEWWFNDHQPGGTATITGVKGGINT